tara:strand:+ start:10547 stop:12361 length:1815 start_codon:yes stop_codon:yes gene_type:complete
MSGAYDDCGSAAYTDGQTFDLLAADYGDASQLTWYVGDDDAFHTCAHNLMVASTDFENSGVWFVSTSAVVAGTQLVELPLASSRITQNLTGTSGRYAPILNEALTQSLQVEAVAVTTPGTVSTRISDASGNTVGNTETLTNVGDVVQLTVTRVMLSTSSTLAEIIRAVTFRGTVKITNVCLSVGTETFPYIQTTASGARYTHRLPENLRRWNGTTYTTSKIVELNTNVAVNALVEGVAVTNQLRSSSFVNAVVGDLSSSGAAGSNWTDGRNALFTSDGGVQEVTAFGMANGMNYIDLRISGTFTGVATADIFTVTNSDPALVGEAWTNSMFIELIDETATAGYTNAKVRLLEYTTTTAFLGTTSEPLISLAALQALSIRTPWVVTADLIRPTVANVGFQFRITLGVGAVDMTMRLWSPMITKTAYMPQPIQTSEAIVTRAAEGLTTSDFAGASTNGAGSVKTSFAVSHNGSTNAIISMNSVATPANFLRLLTRDVDLDGDRYAALFNRSDAGDSNTSFTEQFLTDRVTYCAFGWSPHVPSIILAVTDLTTPTIQTITPTEIETDLGATISLGSTGGSVPVAGYITADYIPNVFLTEAQYTGEAT